MGILQVFDSFYESADGGGAPQAGQLYWVPTSNVDEVPRIFEARRATASEHAVTDFEICEIGAHHFKPRERLPIHRLNLGETEELIVSKAKKRLVVVLASIATDGVATLPGGTQRRHANHLEKSSYLVAPLYSVSMPTDPKSFGPVLVARIRALQYPHFFCLPDRDHPERPRSIIRLDRVFPTYLGRGSESFGVRIHPEPFEIILSQFSILMGGVYREPYDIAKELVQTALPEELQSDPASTC